MPLILGLLLIFSTEDKDGNAQTLKVYQAEVLPHQDKPAGTILSADKMAFKLPLSMAS